MDKTKLKDALHFAGSIASITGITLVWLKDLVPQTNLVFAVPIYLVASLLAVGVAALSFIFFEFGRKFFLGGLAIPHDEPTLAGKIAYTGLVGGLLMILTLMALWWIFALSWVMLRDAPSALRFQ